MFPEEDGNGCNLGVDGVVVLSFRLI